MEYLGISKVLVGTNLFKCYAVCYNGIFRYRQSFTGNQPVIQFVITEYSSSRSGSHFKVTNMSV